MDRTGQAGNTTTQKYQRALPDADDRNVAAFDRIMNREMGELIALRLVGLDFATRTITVGRVIIEVSEQINPRRQRYVTAGYPKTTRCATTRSTRSSAS